LQLILPVPFFHLRPNHLKLCPHFFVVLFQHLYLNEVVLSAVEEQLFFGRNITLFSQILNNFFVLVSDGFYLGQNALAAGIFPEDLQLICQFSDKDMQVLYFPLQQVYL